MKKDVLIVVDMQNDFVRGSLGTKEAIEIIGNIKDMIRRYKKSHQTVIFTRDTHGENYLDTQEGKLLPVPHCIHLTSGWEIISELSEYVDTSMVIDKETFGYPKWKDAMRKVSLVQNIMTADVRITLVGVCTDICVISNAILLKTLFPNAEIVVNQSCCAGTTPENHADALKVMQCCQITIV